MRIIKVVVRDNIEEFRKDIVLINGTNLLLKEVSEISEEEYEMLSQNACEFAKERFSSNSTILIGHKELRT